MNSPRFPPPSKEPHEYEKMDRGGNGDDGVGAVALLDARRRMEARPCTATAPGLAGTLSHLETEIADEEFCGDAVTPVASRHRAEGVHRVKMRRH